MSRNQLRYVLAIAEHSSFTKAADELHISPGTLSEQVRKFEQELGVRIFERTTRTVTVTPPGRAVLEHAVKILGDFTSLEEAVDEYRSSRRGDVLLGTPPHHPIRQLSDVLAEIGIRHPGISVRLAEAMPGDLLDRLQHGKLEISLLLWPSEQPPDGLELIELQRTPVGVVVSSSHPMATEAVIHLKDLACEPMVTFSEGATTRDVALEVCARAGIAPNIVFESSIPEMVWRTVAAGRGFSILKHDQRAEEADLQFVPCDPVPQDIVLGIAWPIGPRASSATRVIRDEIRELWQPTTRDTSAVVV